MTDAMTNLLRLLNVGHMHLAGVCRTSDGFYLGREQGDISYNVFIGVPSAPHPGPGRDAMLRTGGGMSETERVAVYQLTARPLDGSPIPLHEEFGVPLPEGWPE